MAELVRPSAMSGRRLPLPVARDSERVGATRGTRLRPNIPDDPMLGASPKWRVERSNSSKHDRWRRGLEAGHQGRRSGLRLGMRWSGTIVARAADRRGASGQGQRQNSPLLITV
jgi:hypothetical protein